MIRKLKELRSQNKLASIYTNHDDTSRFMFGQVIGVNDDRVAIYLVSPTGFYDGILVKSTDSVFRIEIDDQYSSKMDKLCSSNNLKNELILDENNIAHSLLDIAQKSKKIMSCSLLDSLTNDITGFVENIDNGLCTIKQVDQYGYQDGYSYVMIDDISQISYDSEDEQTLLKLWNKNYSIK